MTPSKHLPQRSSAESIGKDVLEAPALLLATEPGSAVGQRVAGNSLPASCWEARSRQRVH